MPFADCEIRVGDCVVEVDRDDLFPSVHCGAYCGQLRYGEESLPEYGLILPLNWFLRADSGVMSCLSAEGEDESILVGTPEFPLVKFQAALADHHPGTPTRRLNRGKRTKSPMSSKTVAIVGIPSLCVCLISFRRRTIWTRICKSNARCWLVSPSIRSNRARGRTMVSRIQVMSPDDANESIETHKLLFRVPLAS